MVLRRTAQAGKIEGACIRRCRSAASRDRTGRTAAYRV